MTAQLRRIDLEGLHSAGGPFVRWSVATINELAALDYMYVS